MRKWMGTLLAALLTLCGVLCFSGCSAGGSAEAHETVTKFSSEIEIAMGESKISCKLQRKAAGDVSLTVDEPVQLSGMGFEWKNNRYAISYNGLRTETENPFLPSSSFASAVVAVLDAAENGDALKSGEEKDGLVSYQGESSCGAYQYLVNSETGYIEQILLDNLGIKAVLSNHQKIEQPAG